MSKSKQLKALSAFEVEFRAALESGLSGLTDHTIALDPPIEKTLASSAVMSEAGLVQTQSSARDDSGARAHIVVPVAGAVALGCLLMGTGTEGIEERKDAGLDEEAANAFGEVITVANGVLSRGLEALGAPALHVDETSVPADGDDWLPEADYRRLSYEFMLPDAYGVVRLDLLFSEELGEQWFGDGEAPSATGEKGVSEVSDAEDDLEEAEEPQLGPLVFVDGNEDDRSDAEALEDVYGVTVWTFEPAEFGPDLIAEIAEASAVFVEWDLGGQSGLDVLETLIHDERTGRIPVVLCSAAPTRSMVNIAIRTGASSFVMKPFDADEVRRRLAQWVSLGDKG